MLSQSDLKKIADYFATQPVTRAFVFGSFARNEETPESDLDLLIELEKNAKIGLVKFATIKLDLEDIFKKKVDLLEEGGVSKHILPFIEKEKKLIYEKRTW